MRCNQYSCFKQKVFIWEVNENRVEWSQDFLSYNIYNFQLKRIYLWRNLQLERVALGWDKGFTMKCTGKSYASSSRSGKIAKSLLLACLNVPLWENIPKIVLGVAGEVLSSISASKLERGYRPYLLEKLSLLSLFLGDSFSHQMAFLV
jgi:hypothetical protein